MKPFKSSEIPPAAPPPPKKKNPDIRKRTLTSLAAAASVTYWTRANIVPHADSPISALWRACSWITKEYWYKNFVRLTQGTGEGEMITIILWDRELGHDLVSKIHVERAREIEGYGATKFFVCLHGDKTYNSFVCGNTT
jgi:hypothetical protein